MSKKKIAIITGASSGLGREFVKLIAKENSINEIWAIARDKKKLEKLTLNISSNIKTITMDLSKPDNILEFQNRLKEVKPRIVYLVNNAGYAKFCHYGNLGIDTSVNMIDLNCSGVVAMGLACIPYMKRGSRILNVASQASFQPLPYLNIYGATKAFVRNYSRALNIELRERGIMVTTVCPGWMKTDFINRARIGSRKTIRHFYGMVTPNKVAQKALRDAKMGKDISVYGGYTKACHVLSKLFPQRMVMKVWLKQQGM